MRSALLPSLLLALVLLVPPLGADEEKEPKAGPEVPETPESRLSEASSEAEPAEAPLVPVVPAEPDGDPRSGEVPVPAGEGWDAFLMFDNAGVGVWTVRVGPFFPDFAAPEVHAVDDRGRLHVLTGYSGRWSATTTLSDRIWLGGLFVGDVDPRISGSEVYTGGGMGNLYCVATSRHGVLDSKLVAFLPGHEIHTIVGVARAGGAGRELLVFTNPPALYRVSPDGEYGAWVATRVGDPGGLVRNAVVLGQAGDRVACVSRAGWVRILRLGGDGPAWETVHEARTGVGRVAASPDGSVIYSTLDDGRVLRHERAGDGGWETETIFLGPQGPRGLVTGRFFDDGREALAIFGYSKRVQLLSRGEAGWEVETILRGRDKGHWLATGELDGRNSTDEIVATGYDGRVYLLARPPGYGRAVLTDDE